MAVGPWQAIIVLLVVLILFGAGKLPTVMKDLGHGLRNFKKALREENKDDDIDNAQKSAQDTNNASKQGQ